MNYFLVECHILLKISELWKREVVVVEHPLPVIGIITFTWFIAVLPRIFGLFEYSNNWARIIVFIFIFVEFPKSENYSNIRIIDPNTTNNLLVYLQ